MIYNVRDFGAVGDSHTIDTKSVQEAIDTVSKNGGGTLVFDEGVYVVSTIFIKKGIYTMPQFIEYRFDNRVKTVMSVFWLIVYVFVNLTSILYFLI